MGLALGVGVVMRVHTMGMGSAAPADMAAYVEDEASAELVSEEAMPDGLLEKELVVEGAEGAASAGAEATGAFDADMDAGGAADADDLGAGGALLELFVSEGDLATNGGAFDGLAVESYVLAQDHPVVVMPSGEVLDIVEHDGGPGEIGPEWSEGLVCEALAYTPDGSESVDCSVFALPVSDDGIFAVSYGDDGRLYAARMRVS